jgi:hypothetical protein
MYSQVIISNLQLRSSDEQMSDEQVSIAKRWIANGGLVSQATKASRSGFSSVKKPEMAWLFSGFSLPIPA